MEGRSIVPTKLRRDGGSVWTGSLDIEGLSCDEKIAEIGERGPGAVDASRDKIRPVVDDQEVVGIVWCIHHEPVSWEDTRRSPASSWSACKASRDSDRRSCSSALLFLRASLSATSDSRSFMISSWCSMDDVRSTRFPYVRQLRPPFHTAT
jgi:hypothetical protein